MKLLLIQPNAYYFGGLFLLASHILYTMPKTIHHVLFFFVYSPAMWTFQEYLAHRFLMHGWLPSIRKAHFQHHKQPHHVDKIFIPVCLTIAFTLGNGIPMYLYFGYWNAWVNFASYVFCYFAFEYVHWNCHCVFVDKKMEGPRMFHRLHHHPPQDRGNMEVKYKNYGFTSATWDILFGTCDPGTANHRYSYILWIPFPVLPLMAFSWLQRHNRAPDT